MLQKWKLYKTAPYVSGLLVAVNAVIFLCCTFGGDLLYNMGSLSPYGFWEKQEYYRIVTAMFLHGDIQHLINNMLLLFGLGAMIEKEIGHLPFALFYFTAGLGANMVSLVYKVQAGQWYVESIGASGAVFGLVGALLAITFLSGLRMPNVTPGRIVFVVVYSVASGMGNNSIDNAAHLGGLAMGMIGGSLLSLIIRIKNRKHTDGDGGYYNES